jgi:hypothetical protein
MSPKDTYAVLEEQGMTKLPTFARDFGAQPDLTDSPLFTRTETITQAFKTPLATDYGQPIRPTVTATIDELQQTQGRGVITYVVGKLNPGYNSPDWKTVKDTYDTESNNLGDYKSILKELIDRPPTRRTHIMGVDLGHTTNALSIVTGYLADKNSKFVTDFAVEIKPERQRPVNMVAIYHDLIVPLVEQLSVVAVFYDQWSSVHQLQDLAIRYGSLGPQNSERERSRWLRELKADKQQPAFIAERYSLTAADAHMLVARIEQGDFLFPAMERPMLDLMLDKTVDASMYPFAHLALQMATVRSKNNRLLKPVNRDDDLFRAWANCAVNAFQNDLVIDLLQLEARPKKDDGKLKDVNRGYSVMAKVGGQVQRQVQAPLSQPRPADPRAFVSMRRVGK